MTGQIRLIYVFSVFLLLITPTSKVRTWKMHLFTLIQVGCIMFLYGVKLSPGALIYPVVIVLLLPFRWVLGKLVFTKEEMDAVSLPPRSRQSS